jgi:hypothetical protein
MYDEPEINGGEVHDPFQGSNTVSSITTVRSTVDILSTSATQGFSSARFEGIT